MEGKSTVYVAPELTITFCQVDDFIHGNMSHHIIWQRSSTIGRGEPYCDFFPARERTKKGEFLNDAVNSPEMRD